MAEVHMGARWCVVFSVVMAIEGFAALPAAASDHAPVIVIPGRPGVPVMMYGRDVSGAVIEGDWGLYRPGSVAPTIIMPFRPIGGGPGGAHYFPATGGRPSYGRLEVESPASRVQREAEPYYRGWSVESRPGPVTIPTPYDMPPVILDQRFDRFGPRRRP
jgi:hypothetical protein